MMELERCIAAGQWQHVAAILGCSIDYARTLHDPGYHRPCPPPAPVEPKPVVLGPRPSPTKVRKAVASEVVIMVPAGQLGATAPREWVEAVRARREALGWTVQDMATATGVGVGTLRNSLTPSGAITPRLKAKIEVVLGMAERQVAA